MDFGGSDLWDRWRPLNQAVADERGWVPISIPSDRRHGSNWPIWRNQVELDELRQQSRVRAGGANAFCSGLLRNLVNNTIGKGCSYEVQSKEAAPDADPDRPGQQNAAGVDKLIQATQDVVDRFLRLNRWNGTIDPAGNLVVSGSREREIYRRQKRDGETFIRLHRIEDDGPEGGLRRGDLVVRFVEPEQVRDPPGARVQEGWSYGIRHRMEPFEDVETPEEYHVAWMDQTATGGVDHDGRATSIGELVPADEILHLKGADTDSTIKRGTPEFIWDVGEAFDRAGKLQRNASMAAAIRAAIAETWQHQSASPAQVGSLADSLKTYTRTNPTTGATERVQVVQPGTIRHIDSGRELATPPPDQTESYLTGVQGDLRQASAAFCAPEYWTGDASNGNYSSLETASSPAVRAGECEQEYFKTAYSRVVWAAVAWAVECGVLPAAALELVEIKCDGQAVLHRNELEKAQEDQIGVTVGWKDRQTCAAERGLDWELVQANNAEYQDQQMQAQVELQGALGLDDEGGDGNKPPGGNPSPGPRKPLPARVPTGESRGLLESEPHGGEFARGGGRVPGSGGQADGGARGKRQVGPNRQAFRQARREYHAARAGVEDAWVGMPDSHTLDPADRMKFGSERAEKLDRMVKDVAEPHPRMPLAMRRERAHQLAAAALGWSAELATGTPAAGGEEDHRDAVSGLRSLARHALAAEKALDAAVRLRAELARRKAAQPGDSGGGHP